MIEMNNYRPDKEMLPQDMNLAVETSQGRSTIRRHNTIVDSQVRKEVYDPWEDHEM